MNDLMNIENKILVIRDQQVMLDRDLAEIYGYETKNFNRQVKNMPDLQRQTLSIPVRA